MLQLVGLEYDVSNLTTILFDTAVFATGYSTVKVQLSNWVPPACLDSQNLYCIFELEKYVRTGKSPDTLYFGILLDTVSFKIK